jgi:hypothetical protein
MLPVLPGRGFFASYLTVWLCAVTRMELCIGFIVKRSNKMITNKIKPLKFSTYCFFIVLVKGVV